MAKATLKAIRNACDILDAATSGRIARKVCKLKKGRTMNRTEQPNGERPACRMQKVWDSDLPLREKVVEGPLEGVGDVLRGALDRRDARTSSSLIKDAIGNMAKGDMIDAYERTSSRCRKTQDAEFVPNDESAQRPTDLASRMKNARAQQKLAQARAQLAEAEAEAIEAELAAGAGRREA